MPALLATYKTNPTRSMNHSSRTMSSDDDDWSEIPEEKQYRGTKPLKVRKRKAALRVAAGGNRHSRRSAIPTPCSPRSPRAPRRSCPRSPTLPSSLPSPISPRPTMTREYSANSRTHPPSELSMPLGLRPVQSQTKRSSASSSLHLGLGRFGSYDPVCPGPSPPSSPAPSPTAYSFPLSLSAPTTLYSNSTYDRKILPTTPPTPLTPSRAPSKAAKLLGTELSGVSAPRDKPKMSKKNVGAALRVGTRHFRPLPNTTLTEIEKFFGDVPKKPSKTPSGLKTGKSSSSRSGQSREQAHEIADASARCVGHGSTVKHRAEDGSMWLDVEEEQEFAWLMSDAVMAVPSPLPSTAALEAALQGKRDDRGRLREMEDIPMIYEVDSDEDRWGMEAFTSVLSLPKRPRKEPIKKTGAEDIESSFFEFETPRRKDYDFFDDMPSFEFSPWSRNTSCTPSKCTSNPTSSPSMRYDISPPIPLPGAEPINIPSPPARSLDGFEPQQPREGEPLARSSSPPRIRNRPPPITLPHPVVNPRLPVLTATTPSTRHTTSGHQPKTPLAPSSPGSLNPTTPFVRPRAAPAAPAPRTSSPPPARVPLDIESYIPPVPPVPPMPRIVSTKISAMHANGHTKTGAPTKAKLVPREENSKTHREAERELFSFFEPVTPIEPAVSKTKGQGWLKRVRKPLRF